MGGLPLQVVRAAARGRDRGQGTRRWRPPAAYSRTAARPAVSAGHSRHAHCLGLLLTIPLAGLRDRALILVGFVGALRRSELVGLDIEHVAEHPNGVFITIPRSKTNQTGEEAELVVLPAVVIRDAPP